MTAGFILADKVLQTLHLERCPRLRETNEEIGEAAQQSRVVVSKSNPGRQGPHLSGQTSTPGRTGRRPSVRTRKPHLDAKESAPLPIGDVHHHIGKPAFHWHLIADELGKDLCRLLPRGVDAESSARKSPAK